MPGMGKGVAELCGAGDVMAAAGLGLLHDDETGQHVYVALHDGGVVGGLVDAAGLHAQELGWRRASGHLNLLLPMVMT